MHGYFGVNLKRIWKVVKKDPPDLRKKILEVKREPEGEIA
ncbi:MAG: HepT-like ribonuclease domain-containing protein [Thermoplasmata archaeon]